MAAAADGWFGDFGILGYITSANECFSGKHFRASLLVFSGFLLAYFWLTAVLCFCQSRPDAICEPEILRFKSIEILKCDFLKFLISYWNLAQLKQLLVGFLGQELVGEDFTANCVHNRRPTRITINFQNHTIH